MPLRIRRVRVADHREQALAPAARRRRSSRALKILCRQCSELACANIMSSTSVGSRPMRAEAGVEIVDLVRRERQAELDVGAHDRIAALPPGAGSS